MSDTRPKGRRRRAKKSVVLVFGEAGTDRRALAELVKALCPDAPNCKPLRRPLVLVKDREWAAQRKNAVDIASQVYVEQEELEVTLVIAHQDCDACEPADQALALDIEQHLGDLGCPAVAAAPAWEMEAWWYQWPDALLAINRRWRHPNRKGTEIGRVRNAKEQLRRDLRPRGAKKTRDYDESDAPAIAANVRRLALVDQRNVKSRSFDRFAETVRRHLS